MEDTITIGSKVDEKITCSGCEKTLPGSEAYCFKGKDGGDVYFCSDCKAQIDTAYQQETENPNYFGAIALGILAGIIAGLVWYLVETISGYRVGYIALGAGYLVGWAVIIGSGKKRGFGLQLISAAITLTAICAASYFSALHSVNQYLAEELAKQGGANFFLWISPFDPNLLQMIISPMGLFIWGIGIYIAFRTPQANKI